MGWMGRAMVIGDFQCWGIRLWLMVGHRPTVLAVVASGGCCLDHFPTAYGSLFFLPLSGRQLETD